MMSHARSCLRLWCVILLVMCASRNVAAQDPAPGASDPIVPASRRILFADQHALLALPENPNTLAAPSTYTDWARSANLKSLQFQDAFVPALQGIQQARAAAGHMLNQQTQQVAVGRFIGSGTENTIQVDVLTPDGATQPGATATLPAFSLGALYAAPVPESFDVATGKLNRLIDEDGIEHDEVVVCNFTEQPILGDVLFPTVTVLDYTNAATAGVVQTSFEIGGILSRDTPLALERGADTLLSCATGDLDGDGVDEIVVAYFYDLNKAAVATLVYTNDGENAPTVELKSTLVNIQPVGGVPTPFYFGSIDLATGDFNADGRVDIALSTVAQQTVSQEGKLVYATYPGIRILSADANLNLTQQSSFANFEPAFTSRSEFLNGTGSYACRPTPSTQACETTRASVVAGLFKYHPPTGFDFDRRQLAVVYNMPFEQGGGLRAVALEISADLKTVTSLGQPVSLPQQSCDTDFCPSAQRFSVSAGGLIGAGDVNRPEWSLVVSNWEATRNGSANGASAGQFHAFWVQAQSVDQDGNGGGLSKVWDAVLLNQQVLSGPTNARLPAVAWDRDGAGLYLGAPVHMVVYDLIRPQYIIEEPPKHTYWWPPSATTVADGEVLNVSREDGFFIKLEDEQSLDFSQTSRDITDWSIGGSVGVSAKASVTTGANLGIAKTQATGSIEVNGKVSYDYNENKDEYEQDYRSQTTTFTGSTNRDDLLIAALQTYDIWRYPVSGILLQGGLNAFWEISFPGETVTVQGGGLTFDWFTPSYENGNALSYPPLTGFTFTPPDCCADFTFLENGREVTKAIPFLNNRLLAFDGTGATIDLAFSQNSGQGEAKSYSDKLSESLDVKVGYKTKAEVLGQKTETETSVSASLSNSNSWSTMETTDSNTNTSTGFKLNKPAGNPNQAYFFLPTFYLAQDGTTKVSSAVDVLGAGNTFWTQTYGKLPDPALNLPRRFSPITISEIQSIWVPNESDDAKKIRGFTTRFATPDAGGAFPPTSGAVTEGDRLRLEVEVHNYSVGQGFSNLPVQFEAVQYDPISNSEGTRVPINCGAGSNLFLALNPLARTNAVCVWNTAGFGPGIPSALQSYRIYVTLDPDEQLPEIYNGVVGPGQNNQGWGLVTVADPELTFLTPTPTDDTPSGADVYLVDSALGLFVDGQLETASAHVVADQRTPLRVCIDTDQTQTGYYHVLIWQGDPMHGGVLIADKMLPGVDMSGAGCVWLSDFRLEQAGQTTLYAQILETRGDALLGNAIDVLAVDVAPIPVPVAEQLTGVVTSVGSGKANGTVHLSGAFPLTHALALSQARVIVARVLDETEGTGELVPEVLDASGQAPALGARVMGQGDRAVFETPAGQRPPVRVELQVKGRMLDVALKINQTEVRAPAGCGAATELTTDLLVLDGEKAPVEIKVTAPWECKANRDGTVRQLTLKQR